jgi:hypothetical protein
MKRANYAQQRTGQATSLARVRRVGQFAPTAGLKAPQPAAERGC